MLTNNRILLIIGGGIAAFKALDLIRRLREEGASVTPVLTTAAEEFVTPLSASALAAAKVYRDLFDLTDEAEMGHIELSRAADLVVVAPATADLMAKMVAWRRRFGRRSGRGQYGVWRVRPRSHERSARHRGGRGGRVERRAVEGQACAGDVRSNPRAD
jgi:hypothetical protein